MTKLTVAYIPEHFSTPLFLAQTHGYYADRGLEVEFVPVVEGSGRLIKLLEEKKVDVAIGLTEAFVASIANGNTAFNVVGTYVQSPLQWAISTGKSRDIHSPSDLAGKRIGVSRIGSGSYVMSFVLGLQHNFPEPYFSDFPVLHNFQNLRDSVNLNYTDDSGAKVDSDAFMWEHFTSKKYYDNGEIRRVGEIYTPWPLWVVTATSEAAENQAVGDFLAAARRGVEYFWGHREEAVAHILTHLNYTAEDARLWMETVEFNRDIGAADIDWERVVVKTSGVLRAAGVITEEPESVEKLLRAQIVSVKSRV